MNRYLCFGETGDDLAKPLRIWVGIRGIPHGEDVSLVGIVFQKVLGGWQTEGAICACEDDSSRHGCLAQRSEQLRSFFVALLVVELQMVSRKLSADCEGGRPPKHGYTAR